MQILLLWSWPTADSLTETYVSFYLLLTILHHLQSIPHLFPLSHLLLFAFFLGHILHLKNTACSWYHFVPGIRCTPNTDLVLSWILSLPFILRTHFSATDDHTDHPYVLSTCYTSLMGCQEISNASNKKSIISSKIPLIPSENPGLLMHSWPVKHA